MKSLSVPEVEAKRWAASGPVIGEIVIERIADETQNVGTMIDEALVGDFPGAPVAPGIGRRDGTLAIGHGIGGIGNVFAVGLGGLSSDVSRGWRGVRRGDWRGKRQRAVGVQIKFCGLGFFRRPRSVGMPGV